MTARDYFATTITTTGSVMAANSVPSATGTGFTAIDPRREDAGIGLSGNDRLDLRCVRKLNQLDDLVILKLE